MLKCALYSVFGLLIVAIRVLRGFFSKVPTLDCANTPRHRSISFLSEEPKSPKEIRGLFRFQTRSGLPASSPSKDEVIKVSR